MAYIEGRNAVREALWARMPLRRILLAENTQPEAPKVSPLRALREVFTDRTFWKFLFLLSLLSLVKMMFQHMHFTWPKYVTRELGDEFPVGTIWSINSFLILFLAPLGTALTRNRRPLDVLLLGAFISAASPFVLCFGSTIYHQVAMILVLTIGEALWSPRLYEYNLSVAPRGRLGLEARHHAGRHLHHVPRGQALLGQHRFARRDQRQHQGSRGTDQADDDQQPQARADAGEVDSSQHGKT